MSYNLRQGVRQNEINNKFTCTGPVKLSNTRITMKTMRRVM